MRLPIRLITAVLSMILALGGLAQAEVVRIDVRRRDDAGTHERIIGRVHFAVRPGDAANRDIADLALAPVNAAGLVEFSSDLLFFLPKTGTGAPGSPQRPPRGTVFLEVVNRGGDQSLGLMSGARQRDYAPEAWDLGDRFVLEQGFTVAFLGWQFDVAPSRGLTFDTAVAGVGGVVRGSFVEDGVGPPARGFGVQYCAADPAQATASLTFRTRFEETPRVLPRDSWQFSPDGCAVLRSGFEAGLYEAVYTAQGSPVAGLGLAAIRDFASYLKHGGTITTLRENPALMTRVIGFGYSQSARLLRDFVRDGFNADERGRQVFDGLFIASAGAGGGSFNHRFAMPGQAGNSVLSALRPVDLPPFTDEELLARAAATRTTPRVFYTFSSTEYWARAGSLTHTSDDATRDVPFSPSSRLYFLSGTPHAAGPLPPRRDARYQGYRHGLNFAEQRWVLRALLIDLDEWSRSGTEPPPSHYPTRAAGDLVPRESAQFPTIPGLPFASYVPPVYRMDLGAEFNTTRVITREPPVLGAPYPVLIPQVNADGNDRGGVPLPEIAVPLGTFTGWNVSEPPLAGLRYLGGLIGSFEPFARTAAERMLNGDARPSIAERYTGRQDYLDRVRRAAGDLVTQRFLLAADVDAVVQRAAQTWDVVAK